MPIYTPIDLATFVEARMSEQNDVDVLTNRENKRLLEMWCAARFGLGYSQNVRPCRIQVEEIDEQREFDFHQVIPKDELRPFQTTEIKDSEWHRSWEYKNLSRSEIEERQRKKGWMSEGEAVDCFRKGLQSKLATYYSGSSELNVLLYANIHVPGLCWNVLECGLKDISPQFSSVWVVSENMIACVFGIEMDDGFVGWHRINDV